MNELLNNYVWNNRDNMVAVREMFHHYDFEAKTLIDNRDLKTEVANKWYINCYNVLYYIFTFNFFRPALSLISWLYSYVKSTKQAG